MVSRLVKQGMNIDDARDEAYAYYKDDIRGVEYHYIPSFSMIPGYEN